MNELEFLNVLQNELSGLSKEEKEDIIYDYEEHFSVGLENGKTEEEIAKELGNPQNIANSYKANVKVEIAEKNTSTRNVWGAAMAVIGLSLFNLIFVLGPFLGLIGVVFGVVVAAISIVLAGVVMFLGTFIMLPSYFSFPLDPYMNFASMFAAIGITCLGLLCCIGCWYLVRFTYKIIVKYLRFNLNVVKNRRG